MSLIERVYAQIPQLTVQSGSGATFESVANQVIAWISIIAGVLAVLYLLYSGVLYLTAGGNTDATKKAQQGIINAIIGLVIIVLARVVVIAVINTLARTS